jgi:hypothetical protein
MSATGNRKGIAKPKMNTGAHVQRHKILLNGLSITSLFIFNPIQLFSGLCIHSAQS